MRATAYTATHTTKNIDRHGLDTNLYGREATSNAARICSWASAWGIRQFQQIGGPSVTVWRELRRLEADGIEQKLLQKITQAADDADWATYTELMGGVNCARKDRPLRPLMIEQPTTSKYGEVIKTLKGLLFGHFAVRTRFHEWTVRVAQSNADADRDSEELTANQHKEAVQKAADFRAPPQACATLEFCQ